MEYKLKFAIKSDEGKERSALTIKDRVKGADLLVLDEAVGDVAKTLKLVARMCQISSFEVEQLDASDIEALSEIITKKRSA